MQIVKEKIEIDEVLEKKKLENTNELLIKELNTLKDKIIRLKDAYLNGIISLEEYKEDKTYLEKE